MNDFVQIGEIWQRNNSKTMICILAICTSSKQVFVSGLEDQVNPVFSFDHLKNSFNRVDSFRAKIAEL